MSSSPTPEKFSRIPDVPTPVPVTEKSRMIGSVVALEPQHYEEWLAGGGMSGWSVTKPRAAC